LSIEPLLDDLRTIDLNDIHWVIVGGERGRRTRPMQESWVLDVQRQRQLAGVPFFFNRWGGLA
jgi:protein gp37